MHVRVRRRIELYWQGVCLMRGRGAHTASTSKLAIHLQDGADHGLKLTGLKPKKVIERGRILGYSGTMHSLLVMKVVLISAKTEYSIVCLQERLRV